VLQVAILYVPLANRLFRVQPLTATELGVCVGLALVAPAAVELEKWRRRVAEARNSRREIRQPMGGEV
jgi:Ca2+-transporting ATPase